MQRLCHIVVFICVVVLGDDCYVQRLYNTNYPHKASLHCVSFPVFGDYSAVQRLYHVGYIHKVSFQCVFFNVL